MINRKKSAGTKAGKSTKAVQMTSKKQKAAIVGKPNVLSSAVGKKVQFNAQRILVGNPVKGLLVSEDEEWIEVELEHELEGMTTVWEAGEKKSFRKSLIGAIKVL